MSLALDHDTAVAESDATPPEDALLTVEHLTMRFGGLVAINDLSFFVKRGDITALIGPNGAGKTTVFNCVTGFYKPTEGRIVMRHGSGISQDDIAQVTRGGQQWSETGNGTVFLLERMPDFLISQKARVARTFQNIRLFSGMTVLENLLVAQHNALMLASNFTVGGLLGLPSYRAARQEAMDRAIYWLDHINLIERADDPAGDLPYGAQRRLEIIRAMCTKPEILCLDEPAAGLNPRESAELNELLLYIRKEHDTAVLLIEHDMGVVMEISDHVVVLDYGEKISDGSADAVRNDPKVIAAYLGVEDEDELEDVPEVRADLEEVLHHADEDGGTESEPLSPPEPEDETPVTPPTGDDNGKDDLKRISGVGPKLESKLNDLGVSQFKQIAEWTEADIARIDDQLKFRGRIERDDWVGQAKRFMNESTSDNEGSS